MTSCPTYSPNSALIKGLEPFTNPLIEEYKMSLQNKVVNILVKRGFNIDMAESLVKKSIEDAVKIRPEAKPAVLADICSML